MKIKDLYEWAVAHGKTEEDIDITPEFACLRNVKKDRSEDYRMCSKCKHHCGKTDDFMFCNLLYMPSETSFYREESIEPWNTCDFFEAKAMTESERQVTIDGKQYKVKKLKPNYCHCENCVFMKHCGCNEIETPPCEVLNLDESEYFESAE